MVIHNRTMPFVLRSNNVLMSLALFVRRSTRPHHAVLGRLPGTTVYRNVKNFPEAEQTPGVLVWRFDASFYFANAAFFRDQVDRLLLDRTEAGASARGEIRALVLDASGINDLDASAESMLHDIHARLDEAHVSLFLAGAKGPVRAVLARGGLIAKLGQSRCPHDVHQAVLAAAKPPTPEERALRSVADADETRGPESWHASRTSDDRQGDEPWPRSKPSTTPVPSR